jgi:hypothetical protein
MKRMRCLLVVLFFLMAVSTALPAAEIEFTAGINAEKIGMDDVLLYTVTFKGINNPTQPTLDELKDFKVVQTSRSTEFRFVNGVSSYYTNFVYYLMPLKTGMLSIPSVSYSHEGETYTTQPFKVEVVQGSVSPRQPQQRRPRMPSIFDDEDDFFKSPFRRSAPQEIDVKLKVETSRRTAVKGEPILFRILLYTRNRIQSVNMVSNQSFPGFWQEWFPISRSIESTRGELDGKAYNVYEIRKVMLFPTRTGSVPIPSMKFELALVDDSFSFFADTRKINRSTPEVTINVVEPPARALSLPVGDFSFSVSPDKKTVDVNDILSLRIRVNVKKGNAKTLEIPEFTSTDSYKIYPSKISRDNSFNENSLTGVVEAEVPVSFKKTGQISFPPLEFKYYKPDSGEVVTLKSNPFSINVSGVKEKQESAVTLPQSDIIKTGEDIDFIKKGDIFNQEDYYYKTGLFNILLIVFFLFNLLFLLKRVVYDRYISQSSIIIKKKLINKTISRLNNVKDYGEISPILEDYLTGKAGVGLSEINKQSIEALFNKYKINDRDIEIFIKLKSDSELSRFAPQAGGGGGKTGALTHDLKQLIEILKRIDGRIK